MPGTNDAKRELRRAMRIVRVESSTDRERHEAIVARLQTVPELVAADTVMVFDAVPGEPDLRSCRRWCRQRGTRIVVPRPDPDAPFPVPPDDVDVVIVPGLAFTERGHRLGQGGGWYDRFLAAVRPDCVVVGVCFDEQVVASLPVEAHDVPVDRVVTPTRTIVTGCAGRSS